MEKSIKIWNKKLEISRDKVGYMISNSESNLFIHANKLSFNKFDTTVKGRWLNFYNEGSYIGSVWINTDTDTEIIEKFLEEIK